MKKFKNKDWLYNQYWWMDNSSWEIGKICNTNHSNILYWMKKFNIPRKNRIEKRQNHINLSENLIEFINGHLLGDGSLRIQKNYYSARYTHKSKYKEYRNYIAEKLYKFLFLTHLFTSR